MRDVYVKGELSNVKIHTSGHIYFTLKDQSSRLPGVMFATAAKNVKFRPESGMTVLIRGDVNVYESSGQYQLYAQSMQADGIGDYYLAFEQLKKKLEQEGLFAPQHKKQLPRFPRRIAVVTAQTGAAVRDILTTLSRRYPLSEVVLIPTLVQGKEAGKDIVKSIEAANRNDFDVLIVGRGGGSIEDLWAFNEEQVARAIFQSAIPIISAVGHETDTTIADFVADLRAATPTAAAELAVPDRGELMNRLMNARTVLYRLTASKITDERRSLKRLQDSYPLAYPERLYRPFIERINRADESLQREVGQQLMRRKDRFTRLESQLQSRIPRDRIAKAEADVRRFAGRLEFLTQNTFRTNAQALSSAMRTLDALSPLKIMDRGYSITYQNEQVINKAAALNVDDELTIRMSDGNVHAKVTEINFEHKGEPNDG